MTQTLVPDAHLVNSTVNLHKGNISNELATKLLRMEFCIRKLGYKPVDFKQEELLKILKLCVEFNLDFEKSRLKLDVFIVNKNGKLSIWPLVTSNALSHILNRIMGIDSTIHTVLALDGSQILNNVPESTCSRLTEASGVISQLTSQSITASASISKEEVTLLFSAIEEASASEDEFADAVCAKRLLKYLPSGNNKHFIDLQALLDTGFRKAHIGFTSL
ncbi:hypothetical protein H5185_12420 [Shewanella sp. SG44-6]|uniref:hypothetical protein n=1 Tax=Shewanella sp. SG44-6 TaxID=2760959 RepID=UPI0016038951|nr:hypothetical protein [Shewanella sp. SG44-6]MBB1390219.1 hypothetical protein [Shewanella sp. SG44-6]